MSLVADRARVAEECSGSRQRARSLSRGKRLRCLVVFNLLAWSTTIAIAETSLRLFSTSKYWVHTNHFLVGSGQTEAGKKWWPNTTYSVDGCEFSLKFRTNGQGYRALPATTTGGPPYRIAFVGDSFTEGMQVASESTFCVRIERLLNESNPQRPVVCENFGVSATDLFDYWHRIIHDVLPIDPPDAVLLCIYPGNDFQCVFPDDGFDARDWPVREYFHKPGWIKHVIAWINLHSKLGFCLQRALFSIGSRREPWLAQGPKNWWTDPTLAFTAPSAPALRRSRALFHAISQACRRSGTELCILVVGPVANYKRINGSSPLAEILANWSVDVPVIDVAVEARSRPDWYTLVFPLDGHLNESGHAFVAEAAARYLRTISSGAAHRNKEH
jgi:lysophospholipase L1-like esterase